MADLADLRHDLERFLEDSEPLQHAIGQAGKKVALEQASKDLGGDRAFSGLRRKVSLGAGYDLGTPVVLNLRPAGLWVLADKGRKRSGRIYPRRRGNASAVRTPQGPRAWSSYRPTSGFKTIDKIENELDRELPKAVEEEIGKRIREVFG